MRSKIPYRLIIPFAFAYLMFWFIPLLRGLSISLKSNEIYGSTRFVGLDNYYALFSDERFLHAIRNTFVFAFWSILLIIPLSVLLAMALNKTYSPLKKILSFCLVLPGLTPPSVLALLFLFIFNGRYGILNAWIIHPITGITVDWIKDPHYIKTSLVIQEIWRWLGFITIYVMVSIENIPRNYYHIAASEGAGPLKQFFTISLPLLKSTLLYLAFFIFLDAFVLFEGAYVLLGNSGGTEDAGLLLITYIYHNAFALGKFGYASAMSFSFVPAFVVISILFYMMIK